MTAPILERIRQRFLEQGVEARVQPDALVVSVVATAVLDTARQLSDCGFDLLLDVTAIDWCERTPRFDVVYHFYSTTRFVRVRMKTSVSAQEPVVDSLAPFYGSARFAERECHDMYGIVFRGNPDLRPILLYEGFAGHPLRKDYPKLREQPLVPYRD